MNYFCILENKPLSVALFVTIFSHSVVGLFVLFRLSFAVQKLLSLIGSHLFIFVSIALGDKRKKTLLQFISENVLSMYSPRSFMVYGFNT